MPRRFLFGSVLIAAAITLAIASTRDFVYGFEGGNLVALGLILFLATAGVWFMTINVGGTAQKLAGFGVGMALAIGATGWFLAATWR